MPFTIAHAAAALPLRKLKLVWSAFVIGTFAPDFQLFLNLTHSSRDAHHFPELATFTLPAAFVALWLLHNVVKNPVAELLPDGLRLRLTPYLGPFSFVGVRRFAAIMGSLILGIATHLLWDSITHPYTWAYYQWEWLRGYATISVLGDVRVEPHCRLLQYASSVLGCVAVALWLVAWYRRTAPANAGKKPIFTPAHRLFIVLSMLSVPWMAALILAFQRGHILEDFSHLHTFATYLVLLPGTLLWGEIFLYALVASQLYNLQRSESR